MRSLLLIFTIIFSFQLIATAQTDTGDPYSISISKINRNVYMASGKGGNIGLSIGTDGVFLIDDQFAEGIPTLIKKIKKITKKPIKFIVNTHHHPDHIGGNSLLTKEGAIIFSQENTRKRIETMRQSESKKVDRKTLPVITINEDLNFYFNGEKIMIFHVHNAHTDGDIMVYFTKSNVLHTGDAFVNGLYPFIDHESGGSVEGYYKGLENILMVINDDTKIIPGHGKLASKQDVTNSIKMMTNIWKRVGNYYTNKKTLEEILSISDISTQYDNLGYGDGFITSEKFIRTIYADLLKENGPIDNRTMEQRLQDQLKEQKAKKKGKN